MRSLGWWLAGAFLVVGCASTSEVVDEGAEPATTEVEEPEPATTSSEATTASTATTLGAEQLPPVNAPAGLVPEDYDGRLLMYSYVIDEGDGPVLCLPAIDLSDPPQCDGAPLAGLDWGTVEHQERRGTRWGQYVVIGHWDGITFTVTGPPTPMDWLAVEAGEGLAGAGDPTQPGVGDLSVSDLNEIERQVLELSFEIEPVSGILGTAVADGEVQVGVWLATEDAQARLDEQFGAGVVRLMGLLWAIDAS